MPFLLVLILLASSAKAVVETRIEAGEAQIYQSVETTVNGETVRKESYQPGKLELEIATTPTPKPTPKLTPTPSSSTSPMIPIIEFVRQLLSNLTNLFR